MFYLPEKLSNPQFIKNPMTKLYLDLSLLKIIVYSLLLFVYIKQIINKVADISIPRVDSKSTGKGHKDFEVKLGKGITLQQDQLRRDFYINALAKDIDTGEVIDVERKGMTDIKNKEIRMISPVAFEEDPLRMLRAIQFAARFDFKIESISDVISFEETIPCSINLANLSITNFEFFIYLYNNLL